MGRCIHGLLAVIAVSVSVEHVLAAQDGVALHRSGHEEFDQDMSGAADNDGEAKIGHYGDYSDWVKEFHLGAHVPAHATEPIAPKEHQRAKVVSAPKKHRVQKERAPKAVEPVVKAKEEHAKKAPVSQKSAKKQAKAPAAKVQEPKKQAAPAKVAVPADPADELEAELEQLEQHKSPEAEPSSVKSMVEDDQKAPKEASAPKKSADKKEGKHNLMESKGADVSLDSLEASLKDLEATPTALIQTPFDDGSKSFESGASSDTMGAVYSVSQDDAHLTNFPNARVHKKAAVKAFKKTVHTEQVKTLGESQESKKTGEILDQQVHEHVEAQSKAQPEPSFDAQLDKLQESASDAFDAVTMIQVEASSKAAATSKAKAKAGTAAKAKAKAKSHTQAPDMMALLARKFKKAAKRSAKKQIKKAVTDEDHAADKEVAMAEQFQAQFTQSLTKHLKSKDDQKNPTSLKQAMKRTFAKDGADVEKVSHKKALSHENSEAMRDAEAAKKMTAEFVTYRKQQAAAVAKQDKAAPTKTDLTQLFGKQEKVASDKLSTLYKDDADNEDDDESVQLGESSEVSTSMSKGDSMAQKFAQQALAAASSRVPSEEEQHGAPTKDDLNSLFGVSHSAKKAQKSQQIMPGQALTHRSDHQSLGEGHASLLSDSDRQAVEIQRQMTERMVHRRIPRTVDEESPQAQKNGIAGLFGLKKTPTAVHHNTAREQQVQNDFQQQKQLQESMLQLSHKTRQSSSEQDTPVTKDSVQSLFAGSAPAHKQDRNTVGQREQREQQEMLRQQTQRKPESVGESEHDSREQVEHMFGAGKKAKKAPGKLSFLQPGERKKLAQEFSDSAQHQIKLLRQMNAANKLAQRSEQAVQEEVNSHSSKWDELAYQNKLRKMFGVSPKAAPKRAPLTHKKAVSQFEQQVQQAEGAVKRQEATQQTSEYTLGDAQNKFESLIQEETSQFNQLMKQKSKQLGNNDQDAKVLEGMKQQFDQFNSQLAQFDGVKESREIAKPMPREDALLEVNAGPAQVVEPNSDATKSSMLERVSQMFRDA
eukprot:TRINITY_DN5423_c0_g2_i2.p1 TRINITY_DN5423_c0_g2~~TRINITY_DN5423_c0_g2_i2.p1  ORF type:complete len:1042 (+),score=397.56 TRINITY_DN5423_c0_g2_i2:171-3296(+)